MRKAKPFSTAGNTGAGAVLRIYPARREGYIAQITKFSFQRTRPLLPPTFKTIVVVEFQAAAKLIKVREAAGQGEIKRKHEVLRSNKKQKLAPE